MKRPGLREEPFLVIQPEPCSPLNNAQIAITARKNSIKPGKIKTNKRAPQNSYNCL